MNTYSTINYGGLGFGVFPRFSNLTRCAFSWGTPIRNMSFRHGPRDVVRQNLDSFLRAASFGPLSETITMEAQNADRILNVDTCETSRCENPLDGRFVSCDAIIWRNNPAPVIVKPADCMVTSIMAIDEQRPAFGIVHTGFRGVDARLLVKAIEAMGREFNADPQKMIIAIAPHIAKESYFVRSLDELKDPEQWRGLVDERDGLHFLNSRELLRRQLVEATVPPQNVEVYDVDTYAAAARGESFSERYFRLHPQNTAGRFAVVLAASRRAVS